MSTKMRDKVSDYSSDKLLEIISRQKNSYPEKFLDFAKNELIRRNVKFDFDPEYYQEIAAMSDEELKKLVEEKSEDFHLEYVEVAREEYIKRGFKNLVSEYETTEEIKKDSPKKYPTLRIIIGLYQVVGVIYIIAAAKIAMTGPGHEIDSSLTLAIIIVFGSLSLMCFGIAEGIRVIIDIEENTRRMWNNQAD